MQNTHFSGQTRQNPVFERSVLKYVSIKNRILTQSGQKSRVCVNTLDRLLPSEQGTNFLCLFSNFSQACRAEQSLTGCAFLSTPFAFSAFHPYLSSKAGRGVAFLILARAKRGRWLVLREFAKYAFLWPDKAKSCFLSAAYSST